MLLTKKVDVKIAGRNIKHFKALGYTDIKQGSIITDVDVHNLTDSSAIRVDLVCDYCGRQYNKRWADYLKNIKESRLDKTACSNCRMKKCEEVFFLEHGCLPTQHKDVKNKVKETSLKKYGFRCALQSEEIKDKIKSTNMDRHGVENPMQVPEIARLQRTVANENLLKDGGWSAISRQQRLLHDMMGGELNHRVSRYRLDIAFLGKMVYLEYDGSGHNINIRMGRCTEEEFFEKEERRYNFLKTQGWKQIKIISDKDLVPNQILSKEILSLSDKMFTDGYNWIEYNLDKNHIICKNLIIYYDFSNNTNKINKTNCSVTTERGTPSQHN